MNEHTGRNERRLGAAQRLAVAASPRGSQPRRAPRSRTARRPRCISASMSTSWMTVSVRLDRRAWRAGSPDGPAATAEQWAAAIGALKSVVIGTHCAPVVQGDIFHSIS